MDSHAVSYTTPSRRNSSRTYQDLAAYHTNSQSPKSCSSHSMEETQKVNQLGSLATYELPLHFDRQELSYSQYLRPDMKPFNVLTSTASHSTPYYASSRRHNWRRHFWFTLRRPTSPKWIQGDHSRRTRSCGRQSPSDLCSKH